ncbi:probable NAD(P)H dehydrogenase subunit CRR3, chloroplastic [Gastrolobium bilobum]|uniref:probable NAD(P)H dehydrogenase subunit CRR3, chloroplastic n=1 Tax=Gastrolobium bilobum TaxID=150636 RepID=UPI002AB0EBE9|nr:probable NAD(P)H dehydrogenase subunit CRR3, chloroplastic [Gastrolobium bilobum]
MFCLSNLSISKPVVANAALPQKSSHSSSSSSSPEKQTNAPKPTKKTITSLPRNKLRGGPPPPTVIQIERIVGAGSFRDGDPDTGDTDVRKSVFDLFLGQALEGPVEKKMRKTGEWLSANAETRFRSNGKRIMMFMFQWMIPIWFIAFLVACGAIKLPFSSPFLDDLLM